MSAESAESQMQKAPLSRRAATGLGLLMALLALALDQAHKYWMVDVYHLGERGRVMVTSFFDLVLVWNQGISYGLLRQDGQTGRYLLAAFALTATVALIVWMVNASSRLVALSLGLIVGGALGNAADRLLRGAVADFFSFHYAGYYWYIFNIADVAIAAGVIGLLLDWMVNPARSQH